MEQSKDEIEKYALSDTYDDFDRLEAMLKGDKVYTIIALIILLNNNRFNNKLFQHISNFVLEKILIVFFLLLLIKLSQ